MPRREEAEIVIKLRGGLKAAAEAQPVAEGMREIKEETQDASHAAIEETAALKILERELKKVTKAQAVATIVTTMQTTAVVLLAAAMVGIAVTAAPAMVGALGAATFATLAFGLAIGGIGAAAGVMALAAVQRFQETAKSAQSAAGQVKAAGAQLKTAFGDATAAGADKVLAGLLPILRGVSGLVKDLAPDFTSLGGAIGNALSFFGNGVRALGPELSALMQSSKGTFQPLAHIALQLLSIFARIAAEAMPYVIDGLHKVEDLLGRVSNSIDGGAVDAAFGALSKIFGGISRFVSGIATTLGPTIVPAASRLATAFSGMAGPLGMLVGSVLAGLVQLGSGALPGLLEVVTALGPALDTIVKSGALQQIGSALGSGIGTAASVLASVVGWLAKMGALTPIVVGLGGAVVAFRIATAAARVATVAWNVALFAFKTLAIAVRLATAAWIVVQWALNAALTANPIGLVVVGLAALAAAVVVAYRRFSWFRTVIDGAWTVLKSVFGWLTSHWMLVTGILTFGIAPAVATIVGKFGDIKDAVTSAVGWARDRFSGLLTFFRELPGKLGSALKSVGDALLKPFKTVWDFVVKLLDKINGLGGVIDTIVPGGKHGIGSKDGVLGIKGVPFLASGGAVTGGGLAVVGEQGPEVVSLPGGAGVYPNRHPLTAATTRPLRRPSSPGPAPIEQGSLRSAMPEIVSNIRLVVSGRELASIVNRERLRAAEVR